MAAGKPPSGSQEAAASRKAAAIVPHAVMEHLAKHTRQASITLLLLRPDASLAWNDHGAGVLFERFLVPALKHTELLANQLKSVIGKFNAQSPAQVWEFVPGHVLVAAPLVDRRQMSGVLVLAGKSENF